MGSDEELAHLRPADAITIDIMIAKVGFSPVAMLTIANTIRIKLKGLTMAPARREIVLGGRSAAKRLGPCSVKALAAASLVKPSGLESG
jgi:hypothetical protein